MRRLVKVILKACEEAHVISGVDADSVVQQRSEEEVNEAGGVAAGRRVVSQCAGECA